MKLNVYSLKRFAPGSQLFNIITILFSRRLIQARIPSETFPSLFTAIAMSFTNSRSSDVSLTAFVITTPAQYRLIS